MVITKTSCQRECFGSVYIELDIVVGSLPLRQKNSGLIDLQMAALVINALTYGHKNGVCDRRSEDVVWRHQCPPRGFDLIITTRVRKIKAVIVLHHKVGS